MSGDIEFKWPEGLVQGMFYARRDCLNEATLRAFVGEDGDAYITIIRDGRNDGRVGGQMMADARFCTKVGGGKSPRVRQAILNLAEAIRLDNIDDPERDEWK